MTDIDWGQFKGNGDFPEPFKFANHGDSIVGFITRLRVANFDDGPVPELTIRLDDGTERGVLASQRRLQSKLAELRPASGDRIAIVYTGDEPPTKPGRSPAKLFDVQLQKGTGTTAQPAAAQAASDLL